jgi:hypothetical protein
MVLAIVKTQPQPALQPPAIYTILLVISRPKAIGATARTFPAILANVGEIGQGDVGGASNRIFGK